MARALLFDNGDYSLHAQITPVTGLADTLALTISSRRRASNDPCEEQVRFFACLGREGLQSLAALIQTSLQAQPTGEGA